MQKKDLKSNKIKNKKQKGFTLIEVLISLLIFGIIAVVVSSIVINMISVAIYTDRRNDILTEINNSVANIRNEMRNASIINTCPSGNNPTNPNQSLFIVKKDGVPGEGSVRRLHVNTNGRLAWIELSQYPGGAPGQTNCVDASGAQPQFLSSQSVRVQNLQTRVVLQPIGGQSAYLIYITFLICDLNENPVFDCRTPNNANSFTPYRYLFAVSTRNT
jgi:prepilin-type N-terminal cleavage/methylation domain-containing protein